MAPTTLSQTQGPKKQETRVVAITVGLKTNRPRIRPQAPGGFGHPKVLGTQGRLTVPKTHFYTIPLLG